MLREHCRVGLEVLFGRNQGEQTKGKVIKMNPTKAKIQTLEDRGNGRGSAAGAVWSVPYSMMMTYGGTATPIPPEPKEPLTFNPFSRDNLLLEALVQVYSDLSPENLACDGEASMTHIRKARAEGERKLRGLTIALGRTVGEAEIYAWHDSRLKYERERQQRSA
jgi:hypothetical protein